MAARFSLNPACLRRHRSNQVPSARGTVPKDPNEPDRVQASVERQRLKRDYAAMFEDLTAYLYEQDPMELNFGMNLDEYEEEVGTILPRALDAESPATLSTLFARSSNAGLGGAFGSRMPHTRIWLKGIFVIIDRSRSSP